MAEMSSLLVFTIGFVSLAGSLSIYATRKMASRKEPATPVQKPLVLPWLVSAQENRGNIDRGPMSRSAIQRPVIITIRPRKDHRLELARLGSRRGSWQESLPPYVSQPAVAEAAYTGFSSIEKCDFGPGLPLAKLQSLPRTGEVFERVSSPSALSKEPELHLEHKALEFLETADRSLTSEEILDLGDGLPFDSSREESQWSSHQARAKCSSILSVASSFDSHQRDSYISCHEFQALGVVIGSGLRVAQAERLDLSYANNSST